ncbi:MAG TPA: hypothetical protein VFB30_15555 [Spirochaetia bacterium]|nr:hypothetical protein [Spirochaetia bacterium]
MFDTDSPSWQNPRVLAILVLVFLSGAACGALTMRAGLHARLHPNASTLWKNDTLLSYDKLTQELNLRPEQRRQLKTILDDYARYHQDLQAQLDDWKATGKNQILRILDPGQRDHFEQMTEIK